MHGLPISLGSAMDLLDLALQGSTVESLARQTRMGLSGQRFFRGKVCGNSEVLGRVPHSVPRLSQPLPHTTA